MMSDDRATVRRQRRESRVQRREELTLLARFMAEPAGRRWCYNFLAGCRIYSTSFATNAMSMAFAEGERNAGLRLINDLLEASPDNYMTMLKEVNSERSRNTSAGNDDGDSGDADYDDGA